MIIITVASFVSALLLVCATSAIAIIMIHCYHKNSHVKKHHHDGHVQQEQELQTEVVYDVPVFPDDQGDDHQNCVTDEEVIVHQNVAYELNATSANDNVVCASSSTLMKNQGQRIQNNISDGEMNICQNVAYEVSPIN